MRIVYLSFSLSIIDGVVIVAILIISFKKTLTKNPKHFLQLSHKENHRRVSSPSNTIVLNEASLESEESVLLEQSTSSTITHELNLDPSTNIENIRSKNTNRLIIAQLNVNSLRYKFDSLVEILRSKVDILLISETKIDFHFLLLSLK